MIQMQAQDPQTQRIHALYMGIRALEGRPAADPVWCGVLDGVGLAWQKFEISDDDAQAFEAMIRSLRFPRR